MRQIEQLLEELKARSISFGFSVTHHSKYFVTIHHPNCIGACGHGETLASALENARCELAKRCNPNKLPEPKPRATTMPKPKAPAMPMPLPRTR